MGVVSEIQSVVSAQLQELYGFSLEPQAVLVNETKPEFEGDYTVVLFSFVKSLKKSPEALGNELGQQLTAANPTLFTGFNVIKGFLNLSISDSYWLEFLKAQHGQAAYGTMASTGKR